MKKKKSPIKAMRLKKNDFESDGFEKRSSITSQTTKAFLSPEEIPLHNLTFPKELPILPVRDIVVFNYMIIPLYVGREKSIEAIEAALRTDKHILVLSQKDELNDEPTAKDIYETGTIAQVLRMLKLPDGRLKILIQGVSRAKVVNFTAEKKFHSAVTIPLEDIDPKKIDATITALMRSAREQSEKLLSLHSIPSNDIIGVLQVVDHPGNLADLIVANLRMKVADAQKILETQNSVKRLKLVNTYLAREIEVALLQQNINDGARESMDKSQKDFFLREQIKAIKRELGDTEDTVNEMEELAKSITKAKMPADVEKEANKQLARLKSMHPDSSETTVTRTYIDWLIDLPWKKFSKDKLDIVKAKKVLDADHYSLEKVKERILDYLSVRKLNPNLKSPILCLVGPPGVGKTSLGRSIAKSLGREFFRISLGGMRDEAEIRGHRRTYVGAMPGKLIQALKQCGKSNPVIMLDEIDKLSTSFQGDPSSALLEVLDPEQNINFTDHYLNVPFDLSKILFICTANTLDPIAGPLLDRMETIRISGYTEQEKLAIAQEYIVPKQIKENGLGKNDVKFSPKMLSLIIQEYTREAGLRNLEREIAHVCRKNARLKVEGAKPPYKLDAKKIHEYLGIPRYEEDEKEKKLPAGVTLGLAWTPVGGDVLHIEVATMPGKGKLHLTGQLGDVMKESAQTAISLVRARSKEFKIADDFWDTNDIHIHVPDGATPKDGPSAGVTIFTALSSAITKTPINPNLVMTGEIALRGKVLPVGGIKEKILAAVRLGMTKAFIPTQNKKNLEDIPKELQDKISIEFIDNVDQLWKRVKTI